MEFVFDLATPEDEPAIRRLLATNPVPGSVNVTYEREPDYFLGCHTMGRFCQVVVARHQPGGAVAGMLCRAARPLFINGQVEEVGYLGQLRVDQRFRGRWLIPRSLSFLEQLHADRRVRSYLATITVENTVAQGIVVERRRRRLPAFRERAELLTLALMVARPRSLPSTTCRICRGSATDLPEIVAFLREHGASKQFFPAYSEEDFAEGGITPGFAADDFFVARRAGSIAGVVGLWDQSAFKQTVVRGYSGILRRVRPAYNLVAPLMGAPALPQPGQQIRYAYAGFLCIAHNDLHVFHVLLRHLYNLAAERGYAYLMVGLTADDPLLKVARQYHHITYRSRLYIVDWNGEEGLYERLDQRIPFVDIAGL